VKLTRLNEDFEICRNERKKEKVNWDKKEDFKQIVWNKLFFILTGRIVDMRFVLGEINFAL